MSWRQSRRPGPGKGVSHKGLICTGRDCLRVDAFTASEAGTDISAVPAAAWPLVLLTKQATTCLRLTAVLST